MTKNVRILLLGDSGVGKTSLIMSLVSEEFLDQNAIPARVEEITIPPDVTPERVPTQIVDFSSREQTNEQLRDEIRKASVIVVVYALNDVTTWQRVATHWLPLIKSILGEESHRPVILAGNKDDLPVIVTQEEVVKLMESNVDIDSCIHCSAKNLKNISEMFYYAQKAVIHPTAPIYNADDKELTSDCRRALTRIFKIVDLDGDGKLNDSELNTFQRQCFAAPLQPQSLDDVKAVIRRYVPDGVRDDGLTLTGFIFLHKLFVQRGRQETTWTVLRKFGYSDSLPAFNKEYLRPGLYVKYGNCVELSPDGYQFLYSIFRKADQDGDRHLSPSEQASLFSLCPVSPWGPEVRNQVETDARGWISLQGFLAQWTLLTVVDVPQLFEYLAYLGYNYEHDNQYSAITVLASEPWPQRAPARSVYQCQVIGARGVGKSTFLQGLLGRSLRYVRTLDSSHLSGYTINAVTLPHGRTKGGNGSANKKHLILHEIDVVGLTDALTQSELRRCDVVCLVYDVTDPKSFDYIARIYVKHFALNQTPVLVVSTKNEQPAVPQDYAMQPAAFCARHRLPPPQPFYCVDHISSEIYVRLATMAAYPRLSWWQSDIVEQVRRSLLVDASTLRRVVAVGGAAVLVGGIVYGIYRWWTSSSSSSSSAFDLKPRAIKANSNYASTYVNGGGSGGIGTSKYRF